MRDPNSSPAAPLEPGRRIGNYEIRRLLGRGSIAEVYRAFSPDLRAEVALKVLVPHVRDEAEVAAWQRRFNRVLAAVIDLTHPNIVRTFDYGMAGNLRYIAMELIEGPSLRDLLSESRSGLPFGQALTLFRQVADAVAYAHSKGVIHLDIKPGNILLAGGTRPVVVDFGLVRILGDEGATTAQFSPRAPMYMSPEQAAGQEITPSADIYSLGVLLYELVTGDVPFKGGNATRIMVQHMQEAPRPPSQLNVNLAPQVEAAILQALAKDPRQRFASPRSMIEAIEQQASAEEYDTVTLPPDEAVAFRQKAREAYKEQEQEESQASGLFGRIARRLWPPRGR